MVLDGVGLIEITIECLKHPIKWDWIRLEWMDWDGWMVRLEVWSTYGAINLDFQFSPTFLKGHFGPHIVHDNINSGVIWFLFGSEVIWHKTVCP